MWRILGKTSDVSVKEKKAVESLERYFSVVRDDLPARFKVCKKTPVEIDLNEEKNELWKSHDKALGDFRELLDRIDKGRVELEEIETPQKSLLDLKCEISDRILESCHFCEHSCNVNRKKGETGLCGVSKSPKIASKFVHVGEEPELVPSYTIFFSGCTFKCQFCQNWDISQNPNSGQESSPQKISASIGEKREKGVKNVNWVGGDPTPNLHNVLASLKECEINIPSVWNSNMYLSKEGMKLLSGTQDIYLTDFKYGNDECAQKYSKVPNYWKVLARNHELASDDSELIIRHLILPEHVECCTKPILTWIAENLDLSTRVNIMDQYRPAGRARKYQELSRPITGGEMSRALKIAKETGLKNVIR